MSQNLPAPSGDLWAQFSADPRRAADVRASDADRDIAAEAINAAYSDGRLDADEHAERLSQALAVKRLGELVPLLSDVVVTGRPAARAAAPGVGRRLVSNGALRSWFGLAILFNVIWLASWLFSGSAPFYYWPIWPMIGTGIPALMAWMATNSIAREASEEEPPQIDR
ncbi:MAG: DUF1707 domain-containing protein [Propionibacteriaceae bacterium]|nr:DUF1707 domain-containing protein [Propionibacteriaceae bacterium]